jgi:hypothetical protein
VKQIGYGRDMQIKYASHSTESVTPKQARQCPQAPTTTFGTHCAANASIAYIKVQQDKAAFLKHNMQAKHGSTTRHSVIQPRACVTVIQRCRNEIVRLLVLVTVLLLHGSTQDGKPSLIHGIQAQTAQ